MKSAHTYIGTPYDELNCWQLVRAIYRDEYNIDLPELPIESHERDNWERVELNAEKIGDLLLFQETVMKRHVGVVVGNQMMVHADRKLGTVAARYTSPQWKPKLQKIYRHK